MMNTTYKHGFIKFDHAGTYFHKEFHNEYCQQPSVSRLKQLNLISRETDDSARRHHSELIKARIRRLKSEDEHLYADNLRLFNRITNV